MILVLSGIKKTYEREVYTIMELLSDFGGFNDGIILIPAVLMHFYSQKMYIQHLFGLLPIKKESDPDSGEKIKKQCRANQAPYELNEADITLLVDESENVRL